MKEKRKKEDEAENQKFLEASLKLQPFEWTCDGLTVIVPKTARELINEGYNNRNCVGTYVDSFIKKQAFIFFVRKVESPETSYITLELSLDLMSIEQAFYCANRQITNEKDISFLKKWLKHIDEIRADVWKEENNEANNIGQVFEDEIEDIDLEDEIA